MPIYEVGTTSYEDDIMRIKVAMSQLGTRCSTPNSYAFGPPVSRFGWTFIQLGVGEDLMDAINSTFASILAKYAKGRTEEKVAPFLADYFESRGCKTKVALRDK